MPVKRPKKPRVAIVGAGNLAGALAVSLRAAGYSIDLIISRSRAESVQRGRRLAREVGAMAVAGARARIQSEVVWFCVPDGAIAGAAQSLSGAADWKRKIALHSSGALTSDALDVLRKQGAAVASVHPLMTFVHGSRPPFKDVPFAIEGDKKAVPAARSLVGALGARAFAIRKQQKEAYHAWGMFVSPLLTALLAASEAVAATAGVSRTESRQRMLPILKQTLENYARLGAPASFSGPIARGDTDTVAKHLIVLRSLPGVREVYIALARSALRNLPSKNRAQLRRILKS